MAKEQYNAESITVLEGLEAVRKRPGMYIGGVGSKGLNHLIYEIILQKMRLPLHEKYSRFITAVIMRQKRGIFSFTSLRCFVLSYVPCIIGTRTQTVVPISFLLSTVTP